MRWRDALSRKLGSTDFDVKTLGEVGQFIRGNGLQKADLTDEGAPAIHYGQIHSYYGTWADRTKSFTAPALAARLRRARPGDLIVATTSEDDAAVAKATAWIGAGEVAVSGDAYIYRHTLDPRYVAYFFQTRQFHNQKTKHITGTKVRRISGDTLAQVRIPVPSVEVQRAISDMLDRFSGAVAELEVTLDAESEARRSQLTQVRELVLDRDNVSPQGGNVLLSDLVEFTSGKAHERLVSPGGSVALLTARFISTAGKSARWVQPKDALTPAHDCDIAMVMSDLPNGRALARCYFIEGDDKYTANQRVCLLRVRDRTAVSPRWLYHFLDRNPQLLAFNNGQDQTHLKKGQILGVRVPIVPLLEQERAVTTLDGIDAGVRDLSLGLQIEREARRKQYEYYRDELLVFDEVPYG